MHGNNLNITNQLQNYNMPNKSTKRNQQNQAGREDARRSIEDLFEEAAQARVLLSKMSTSIQPKSKWFVISMNWISEWEKHVGF
jgi:hypothetical protein